MLLTGTSARALGAVTWFASKVQANISVIGWDSVCETSVAHAVSKTKTRHELDTHVVT